MKEIYGKKSFLELIQKLEQLASINVLKLARKSHILLRMSHYQGSVWSSFQYTQF